MGILVLGQGCASLPRLAGGDAVETHWVVATDGDPGTAVQALRRAALAGGGKPLSTDDRTGGMYAFDSGTLVFWAIRDRVLMSATVAAVGPHAAALSRRRGGALVSRVVAAASQELKSPLQVKPVTEAEAEAESGTGDGGVHANSKWRGYGGYLEGVEKTIQQRWDSILDHSNVYPPPGTYVAVSFLIGSDGAITEIKQVVNHSTKSGEDAALNALTASAPFPPWSADMKSALDPKGEELVFTFYYK